MNEKSQEHFCLLTGTFSFIQSDFFRTLTLFIYFFQLNVQVKMQTCFPSFLVKTDVLQNSVRSNMLTFLINGIQLTEMYSSFIVAQMSRHRHLAASSSLC